MANRLQERFPNGLRVAYRVGEKSFSGKIVNVSPNGGFVATRSLPPVGKRLQLAVVMDDAAEPVWLDMKVASANPEPNGNIPFPGFGGQWLVACSKVSSEHLESFLGGVLDLTEAAIRTVEKPGKSTLFMYSFGAAPAAAAQAPVAKPVDESGEADAGFNAPKTMDSLPVLAAESDDGATAVGAEEGAKSKGQRTKSGRWSAFVEKLSGIRSRNKSVNAVPVTVDFRDYDCMVSYKLGKQTIDAEVLRLGTTWLVLTTTGEMPELWSRMAITVPLTTEHKASAIEIQATLTRTKTEKQQVRAQEMLSAEDLPMINTLYCKITRVDEQGHMSAYKQLVDRFMDKQQANVVYKESEDEAGADALVFNELIDEDD